MAIVSCFPFWTPCINSFNRPSKTGVPQCCQKHSKSSISGPGWAKSKWPWDVRADSKSNNSAGQQHFTNLNSDLELNLGGLPYKPSTFINLVVQVRWGEVVVDPGCSRCWISSMEVLYQWPKVKWMDWSYNPESTSLPWNKLSKSTPSVSYKTNANPFMPPQQNCVCYR